ncbi:MAG: hydroxymethylglutaryl-CoA synthase [Bacteroidetes bacterium]|nr:hydroxymethylglutaryl-CoA synthase [Bacteroidota bacterium]
MKIGIDKISFYIPNYYLDLKLLAQQKGLPLDKFETSLGQNKIACLPPNEDIITMGANAAHNIIEDNDNIDLLIFATESSFDQSKACSIYIHNLLKLNPKCRCIEVKQACYSSTAALRIALNHVKVNPNSRVLVINSDVSRYGLNTQSEPTSGCGAAAFIISKDPNIIQFDDISGFVTKDIMDFWSPNYIDGALVDGKTSIKYYFDTLKESWFKYKELSKRNLLDHHKLCFHLPFSKIALRAYKQLCNLENVEFDSEIVSSGLLYNKDIGNTYTASLYISLLSLLENSEEDLVNKRIGFFAYGSGCVAEFFSGTVTENYDQNILNNLHFNMIDKRESIGINKYEYFYNFSKSYPLDGSQLILNYNSNSKYILMEINNHKRIYGISDKLGKMVNKEKAEFKLVD